MGAHFNRKHYLVLLLCLHCIICYFLKSDYHGPFCSPSPSILILCSQCVSLCDPRPERHSRCPPLGAGSCLPSSKRDKAEGNSLSPVPSAAANQCLKLRAELSSSQVNQGGKNAHRNNYISATDWQETVRGSREGRATPLRASRAPARGLAGQRLGMLAGRGAGVGAQLPGSSGRL